MAFTVNDLQDFTLLLNQHPEWQAEVRRVVLTSELLALPDLVRELVEAQKRSGRHLDRLDTALVDLAIAQARMNEKMAELVAAQARTDEKMAELVATQERFTQEMREFRRVQQQLVTDVGRLKGRDVEQRYIQYTPGYFGKLLRRVRVVWPGTLDPAFDDRLDEYLTEEERNDVLRLDAIIKGNLRNASEQPEIYLAVEASGMIEPNDVARAQYRASLLQKVGLRTLPVVAGEAMTQEAGGILQKIPIVVVTNGHSTGWAETLATV